MPNISEKILAELPIPGLSTTGKNKGKQKPNELHYFSGAIAGQESPERICAAGDRRRRRGERIRLSQEQAKTCKNAGRWQLLGAAGLMPRSRDVVELPVVYCRDNAQVQAFVDERVWDFNPYRVAESMRDWMPQYLNSVIGIASTSKFSRTEPCRSRPHLTAGPQQSTRRRHASC
jgi:hypothetical protein